MSDTHTIEERYQEALDALSASGHVSRSDLDDAYKGQKSTLIDIYDRHSKQGTEAELIVYGASVGMLAASYFFAEAAQHQQVVGMVVAGVAFAVSASGLLPAVKKSIEAQATLQQVKGNNTTPAPA